VERHGGPGRIPRGCPDAQAARAHGAQLREHLGRVVSAEDASKFSALNGALHQGGLFLLVPAGVRVEAPFHFYSWTSEAGTAVLPRLVVVLEEGASARLIEEYAGPAQPDYTLCAPVTEIYLAAGAVLEHTVLQNQGANVFHIALQRAWLGRGARFHTLQVALGAEVGRTDLQVILAEPGARADLLGLSLGEKRQHLDFHTQQRHLAPHTESDLLFKAALRDRARSVFEGWIVIDRAAQQAVAYQANRNLLLSPRAKADSLPVLEIEANDVRCTHGAAVGPIDENQKYYLMSRGLDAATAEQLITLGFFADVVERSPFQEASARALAAIARKFPLEGA
jgi:Fe-S cluster assembly protein SufD